MFQVDVGNYFRPLGPSSALVNQLMLEGLKAMPIRVLNLATEDLFFWKELSRAKLASTQVISTNLVCQDQSLPSPPTHAIVEVPAARVNLNRDLRIGFLGLSNPAQVKPNSRFSALDPVQAVARVKAAVIREVDLLIVLADLPREQAKLVAESHPEIDVLILVEKRFVLHPAEKVKNTLILSSVERGRYLGQLLMRFDASGKPLSLDSDFVELKDGVAEEATLLHRQAEVAAKLPLDAR